MDGPQPPRKVLDPYRIPLRVGALLFVVSIIIHLSLGLTPLRLSNPPPKSENRISDIELRYIQRPTVETLQETAKEKPKDAKFESSRNLKSSEDTSPDSAPTNLAQTRGDPRSRAREKSRAAEGKESGKVFSLSTEDIKREEKRTLEKFGDRGVVDSTGFMDRLKKGQELKVAAYESDYAQFINRMKRKIIQRWSPRVVSSRMYEFDEVSVDIGLRLNREGEIVEMRLINKSSFADFDADTVNAVKESAPFPNPPTSLVQEDGFIYMPWKFSVSMRQSGFRVD